ncbi:secondary thiamine-phosphate synthase enzyme YjbQ [Zooshikella harenae]|uniref:Secondary thiamine-phosphate synthase enzyme YjbQ n=1 Tax=Zooshikella harenae TaxID=2827238 RepID=A0ABS5ZH38_9GAMM|nr:secondary thiamine-phosphate synthase enzyme YjbQ [Zooshikella harenae]MBU2713374.1 secondary thiamine-phosphate synthase enzyme YjbQ [Zooshikella harenae]
MWVQKIVQLVPRERGFHLVTDELIQELPEIDTVKVGLLSLFMQHTSASLTINENADPSIRADFESHLNYLVPENAEHFQSKGHGADATPAHLKNALIGFSLVIPVSQGQLALGAWQGIYLGEHHTHGSSHRIVATLFGEDFGK